MIFVTVLRRMMRMTELNNTVCPTKCLCVRYSFICSSLAVQVMYKILNMPHIFMILSGNLLMDQILSIMSQFKSLVDLTLLSHNLKEFSISKSYHISYLSHLNVSNNGILRIKSYCFQSVPNLIHINMSNNRIFEIFCNAFSPENIVESIILTTNNLTKLKQCVFNTLLKLRYLELFDNDLIFDNKNLFSAISTNSLTVRSSNYLVCCFKGNIQCSLKKDIHNLQCSFLQGNHINTAIWVVSSSGLLINVAFMAKFVFGQKADKDKKNAFKYLVCALHSSDLYFCSYIFFIASIDAYHLDSYVFAKSLWHQRILCHFLSFLSFSYPLFWGA